MTFDSENPPTSYKQFQKEIRKTIEDIEIDSGEEFDTAVFYVDKNGEADIIYAFEIFEEENEEIDPDSILYNVMPNILKENNARFYALVLPAETSGSEVVMLLTGDINETHLIQAEIDREYGKFLELEPWERLDVLSFPELSVPYRRAVTYQG